ncbi:MAG: hypothetical protein K0Q94_6906 [Paenibacillus sp.]|nr:hypothetical protein [Paenibacillus sp.]
MEIYSALEAGRVPTFEQTITLGWYQELTKWHRIIRQTEMYGGMIDIRGAGDR